MKRFGFVRVDDRLLHGQVVLGWRDALNPAAFWIADEAVASDPFSAAIYGAAVPDGTRLVVVAPARLAETVEAAEDLDRSVLLVRSLAVLRALCEAGLRPAEANLGGIHARPGSRRLLDYLHLTGEDRAAARWLLDRGVDLFAQDLPSSPRHPLAPLLERMEGGE